LKPLGFTENWKKIDIATRLGYIYLQKNDFTNAEDYFTYAMKGCKLIYGDKDIRVAYCLQGIARIYKKRDNNFIIADALLRDAIHMTENYWSWSFFFIQLLKDYVQLLQEMKRTTMAEKTEERITTLASMKSQDPLSIYWSNDKIFITGWDIHAEFLNAIYDILNDYNTNPS